VQITTREVQSMQVNEQFLQLLKFNNYTKARFAKAMEVRWKCVWQWTNGTRFPNKENKKKMAVLLGVSVDHINKLFLNKKQMTKKQLTEFLEDLNYFIIDDFTIINSDTHEDSYSLLTHTDDGKSIVIAKYNFRKNEVTLPNADLFILPKQLINDFIDKVKILKERERK
jgi:hypothetical protein